MITSGGRDLVAVADYRALYPKGEGMVEWAVLEVKNAAVKDIVILSANRYTKGAATNTALRTWADAAGLVSCINDATYGVANVYASAAGTVVTIRKAPNMFILAICNVVGTITVWTSDDDLIQRHITAASGLLEKHYRPLVDDEEEITERREGTSETCTELHLKVWPVSGVESVHEDADLEFGEDTELVEDTDFWVDAELGILHRIGGTWSQTKGSVQVVYTGGYSLDAIPEGLRQACIFQINWMLTRMGAEGVVREKAGQIETYFSAKSVAECISPIAQGIMGAYSR